MNARFLRLDCSHVMDEDEGNILSHYVNTMRSGNMPFGSKKQRNVTDIRVKHSTLKGYGHRQQSFIIATNIIDITMMISTG